MSEDQPIDDRDELRGSNHADAGPGERVNAWSHVPEGAADAVLTTDLAAIRQVIDQVLERRDRGEWVTDAQVIAEHPECMPALAQELAAMHEIHRAYLAAARAGPASHAVMPLSASELNAPLEGELDVNFADSDDTVTLDPPGAGEETSYLPRIEGYWLVHEISRGGQATVYKAVQQSTRRKVALKVLPGGAFAPRRSRERFEREADILARLQHSNLVGILDRGRTSDGSYFLTMEYVDGLALDEHVQLHIAKGPDELRRLLKLIAEIARGVHAAHLAGVIHRDLKPPNIRVNRDGQPRVLDFGLARLINEIPGSADIQLGQPQLLTLTGQVLGTLPWSSPEQASGSFDLVDARSDVYSLGVILYQSLVGKFPYEVIGTARQVMKNIAEAQPKAPSQQGIERWAINAPLDDIVLKALEKSPSHRYATAGELADDLDRYIQGLPLLIRRRRRYRWRWWAAAALVGVVASIAAILIHRPKVAQALRSASTQPAEASLVSFKLQGPTISTKRVDIQLCYIPAGNFQMGSPTSEPDREDVEHLHEETISRPFYIGRTEVTQQQYSAIMGTNPSDSGWLDPNAAVDRVSRYDAEKFCELLSRREGRHYRLPTEKEWEYACRAGTQTMFYSTKPLGSMAVYRGNANQSPLAVAGLMPNDWGLYDMLGGVWEWTTDEYREYDGSPVPPARAGLSELQRRVVVRGGSRRTEGKDCRCARRYTFNPHDGGIGIGFRIAADVED